MANRAGRLLALVAVAFTASTPARASDERVAAITRALAKSHLFVSDSIARAAPDEQVRALRADMRRLPFPAYVVIAPVFSGETSVQSTDDLLTVVHERLGRPGVYVVSDESGIFLAAEAFGVSTRSAADRAISAAREDVPHWDGPVARIRSVLNVLRTGRRGRHSDGGVPNGVLTALAGLAVFAPLTGRWWRRRPRAVGVRAVRAPAPSAAPPRDVERQARAALAQLAATLAAAEHPPDGAFRAYDAASKAIEDARLPVDWVGALVIAGIGTAVAAGTPTAPPCFFDPLHGAGEEETRWRLGGKLVEIPACRSCAALVRHDHAPASLLDRGRPYWEHDTVWAHTGFGALDAGLVDRVLAGDRER